VLDQVDPSYLRGPGSAGLESLSKEEMLAAFRQHEREGLCHTVWSYVPPFIGSICTCDRSDCLAMRATLGHATPALFRAEYVGRVDRGLCKGCRAGMCVCPFGAIAYSAAAKQVTIDPRQCYGCGICRSVCPESAIVLDGRSSVLGAAHLW
jgi:ferredoxin